MRNKAFVTVATGEYNLLLPNFVNTFMEHVPADLVVFTDQLRESDDRIKYIQTTHLGWPQMPLLRSELFANNLHKLEDYQYLYCIDVDVDFVTNINETHLESERVGTLHRNITRLRKDFNYESRTESTAYIAPDEGEKYYAGGLYGGTREEFGRIVTTLAKNIRQDINNGIRAVWGDESHINRYFIDNPPTQVLDPTYLCPKGSSVFRPKIELVRKSFKTVDLEDAEKFLTIDPDDYKDIL